MNEDELKVSLKERNGKINDNTPAIILYVSAPVLKEVEFSGGGKVEMRGQIEMPGKLAVELNGATNFVADSMAVGSLELETNGASKCSIAKLETIGNVEIEVNGAGDIDVNVFCQDLRIEMNGAGKGTFSGECKKLVCEENGASKIDFSKLKR